MTEDTTDPPVSSRHLSKWIDADAAAVYAFASDARELPRWAAGLADPALADADVRFAPRNEFGVLDHVVRLPSGEEVYNPMRVIPAGTGEVGCEVVFTLRRRPGVTDEEFDADSAAVAADLDTLCRLVLASD
ncbi:SRPBCC family protein [Mycolicibacterium hodleri]|uniref:SRPBCC family protein n=1 Tax=Mycolicibacterium hodleri TaxID=49897 RepID=A0A502E399_9MYCO|nr:SRPBCC family protein [Mycolicibacterium hodleri]TPG32248.1 SRPBCC family protein [Mycolicibacterium hodleri]